MFLVKVHVENYRSISRVDLVPCGAFNVLIGKNGSGKSNILTSIDTFFSSLNSTGIHTSPAIGDQIDFHQRKTADPISIATTFRLDDSERSSLLEALSRERPQVRNLLENIEPDLHLFIRLSFMPKPTNFAFVQSVKLTRNGGEGHILLEVSEEAARNLYDKAVKLERSSAGKQAVDRLLRSFDQTDYRRSREPSGPPLDYFFRRYTFDGGVPLPGPLANRLTAAFEKSDNFEAFMTAANVIAQDLTAELASIESSSTSMPIRTFTGEERAIPGYVKHLLETVKQTKILHLKERRAQIGSQEAKRLLDLKVQRGGTEQLQRIRSTVTELLGVEVDAFQGPIVRGETTAELDVDQFLIQVNGSGVREALRLILDTEFQEPDILLVEEPEIHLHPALETSIMSYLRQVSQDTQVFITTHSTNFLDTGNFENVFLVTREQSTSVSPLTMAEAEEQLPSELGIRLSSLFMYDQIVFGRRTK